MKVFIPIYFLIATSCTSIIQDNNRNVTSLDYEGDIKSIIYRSPYESKSINAQATIDTSQGTQSVSIGIPGGYFGQLNETYSYNFKSIDEAESHLRDVVCNNNVEIPISFVSNAQSKIEDLYPPGRVWWEKEWLIISSKQHLLFRGKPKSIIYQFKLKVGGPPRALNRMVDCNNY